MKTKLVSLVVMLLIGATTVFAQSKTEKFIVPGGSCEMCKVRIEKAVLAIDGVSKANWNALTKILEFSFNPLKTEGHKLQMAVAMAGYDTKMHRADDKAYNALPECCKYKREKSDKKM